MRRGEIWRVRLPTTQGHTQSGERPALIIQNNQASTSLPTVLLVPFTSKLAAQRFPGTVAIQPDSENGLTLPSVALVFQASAQDKRNLVAKLGQLDDATMKRIFDQLQLLTT